MNLVKRIINLGTDRQTDPIYNKHIRFTNSVSLIVCCFAIQNALLSVYYHELLIAAVFLIHAALLTLMPVFTYLGKRVLAGAWFSSVAIAFVTFYSIAFTLDSLNFVFLTMIIFLQFFLFSSAEKKYIIIFIGLNVLCFAAAVLWPSLHTQPLLAVSKEFINAERLNSFVGIPLLTIAFGTYSFLTIHRAEEEAAREKEKTEQLLLNILPKAIADRFKNDQSYMAEGYESVSVLFADIAGFTGISEKIAPGELVKFLNEVFSRFDELTEAYGLEKIKTIGDAYMVAGGVPTRSDNHTRRICQLALKIKESVQDMKSPGGEMLCVRIGISTGPVTAGVIGTRKFIYDLWGDTVNTASRMESHSESGAIQITGDLYECVKHEFNCEPRGAIQVKGKGVMMTYFLTGAK